MPLTRILLGAFVAVGDPTIFWKFGHKIGKANLLWERVEIWAPKFQRAQKRELGPKKKFQVGGGTIHIFFIYRKKNFRPGLRPVFSNTGTTGFVVFFLNRISIYKTSEIGVATCNIHLTCVTKNRFRPLNRNLKKKKKKNVTEKNEKKKKIWAKKNLGKKKKFGLKKISVKKILLKK